MDRSQPSFLIREAATEDVAALAALHVATFKEAHGDGGRSPSITSMLLFGDARNPSKGFCEHLGAERLFSAAGEFHGRYGWRDLRSVVSDPAREPATSSISRSHAPP
jgi:hypothetical protein